MFNVTVRVENRDFDIDCQYMDSIDDIKQVLIQEHDIEEESLDNLQFIDYEAADWLFDSNNEPNEHFFDYCCYRGYLTTDVLEAAAELEIDASDVEDFYVGRFSSHEDFTKEVYCEGTNVPDDLIMYIDWEKMWDDLYSCDYLEQDGYYFRNM